MSSFWASAWLGLVIICVSPLSYAWDFTLDDEEYALDLTATFVYTYHFDNDNNDISDDKYHQILNTLDLSLSRGAVRLGARFDTNVFANTPMDQHCNKGNDEYWCSNYADSRYQSHFMVERFFLLLALDNIDVTLGDFYASFGKGLALHVSKIDELAQDTTIQGGKLVLRYKGLEATAFAGRINPLDIDTTTGWSSPWRNDPIMGGRLEHNIFGLVTAGFHSVYLPRQNHDPKASSQRNDYELIWGFGVEVPDLFDGLLSLHGEVDIQHSVENGEQTRGLGMKGGFGGLGAYAGATSQIADLTVMVEFKYYDDFQFKAPNENNQPYFLYFHQPPTLDRKLAEVKDNSSVTGSRLRLDYNLGALGPLELLVFANYGFFENWSERDLQGKISQRWIVHSAFGGFELQWQDGDGQLEVNSGIRNTSDKWKGDLLKRDIHVDLTWEQVLFSHHSVNLHGILLFRKDTASSWKEIELMLTYKWSPHLSVVFSYERQEDLSAIKGHDKPQNYFGGSVRYFINSASYINLRVGENRPGLKCFNGVCRIFPPFSGAELSGVLRF